VEVGRWRDADTLPGAMRDLFRLHQARWSARGQSGSFARHPRTEAFHQALARRFLARDWLGLYVLEVDGAPAAALLGYEYHGVFSYYQAGFDPAWAEQGVGGVLMGCVIEDAIRRRLREFDFLRGEEPFKSHWTQQQRHTRALRAWNRTAAATVHHGMRGVVRRARRLMGSSTVSPRSR
jgi:CelD/BcsL family acetyltransferase involved in cellulose biosynthesis